MNSNYNNCNRKAYIRSMHTFKKMYICALYMLFLLMAEMKIYLKSKNLKMN